jgi:hypothetical protein
MKNIVKISMLLLMVVFASCKDNKSDDKGNTTENTESQLYSCPMHPEVKGKKGESCSKCGMELTEPVAAESSTTEKVNKVTSKKSNSSFSIEVILNDYLKLKNALVKDDTKGAALAGKELVTTLNNLNPDKIEEGFKKEYLDIGDDVKEHADHIGSNGGNIEHQREHFALLSKDVDDLIKIFGTDKKLYQDHCPMYDEGKSGYWISETKEIKNPYYGKKMLTCGSMKKEL